MANYDDAQKALDALIQDEDTGWNLSVLGYSLLVSAVIPAVFVFVGWRSGSLFWFWSILGLVVLGFSFVAAGRRREMRAAKHLAAVEGIIRGEVAASMKARELPPVEKLEEQAAPQSERDRAA
ncbi:MAG: hypothetical protein ACE14L_16245 [Terriglobales bacterium]